METITELIVRVTDLAEAEGRLFRAAVIRLALGVGALAIGAFVIVAGVAFLLAAVYIAVAAQAGAAVAAGVVGLIAISAGGLLAWQGCRIGK